MSHKSDIPTLVLVATGEKAPPFKFVSDMDDEIGAVGGYAATLLLLAQTADSEPLQSALRRLSGDLYELQEKLTARHDSLFHELHGEQFPTA
ncbi:MAG TPA: hypothetical protein VK877_04605 [Pseudolabrys sp.]|nr:hypothetical protein [Pseudolabrys sp.]